MAQQIIQQSQTIELIKQLIGEWTVVITVETSDGKVISGCGEMTTVEIQGSVIDSEIDAHIESYYDFFENDLWSFDHSTGKVHLFSVTSEGTAHHYVGNWKDRQTLELTWSGTDQEDMHEQITAKWVTKDQIERKETSYSKGEALITTNFVFKRKRT
jgi:hypothetical protein